MIFMHHWENVTLEAFKICETSLNSKRKKKRPRDRKYVKVRWSNKALRAFGDDFHEGQMLHIPRKIVKQRYPHQINLVLMSP